MAWDTKTVLLWLTVKAKVWSLARATPQQAEPPLLTIRYLQAEELLAPLLLEAGRLAIMAAVQVEETPTQALVTAAAVVPEVIQAMAARVVPITLMAHLAAEEEVVVDMDMQVPAAELVFTGLGLMALQALVAAPNQATELELVAVAAAVAPLG